MRDVPTPVVLGQNGEDILAGAMLEHGVYSEVTRRSLAAWWEACRRILEDQEEPPSPFDLLPRSFTVANDGRWTLTEQDLCLYRPAPAELIGFRALLITINERILPRGYLTGVALTATLRDVVTELLEGVGVTVDDATYDAWLAFEADLQVRVSVGGGDRAESMAALAELADRTVAEAVRGLPLARYVDAAYRTFEAEANAAKAVADPADAEVRVAAAEQRAAEAEAAAALATERLAEAESREAEARARFGEAERRIAAAESRLRRVVDPVSHDGVGPHPDAEQDGAKTDAAEGQLATG
jgi:hypothetical protein